MKYYFIFILIITILLFNQFILLIYNYNKNDIIVLIRISKPTIKQYKRYIEWYKSIKKYYLFYLLSDRIINTSLPNIIVDKYEVINKYPELNRSGSCSNKRISKYLWNFHIEHILLGINKINKKFKYIWIIEQDLVFSCNIIKFLNEYNKYNNDLISMKIHNKTNKYQWLKCVTKEYLEFRKRNMKEGGLCGYEFIQRWSIKLINIFKYQMKMKRHSHSECGVIENTYFNKLSFKEFNKHNLGNKLSCCNKIKEKELLSIKNNNYKYCKIYHPAKF